MRSVPLAMAVSTTAMSLLLTAACSSAANDPPAPEPTGTAGSAVPETAGAGEEPDAPPLREIRLGCDSPELAEALSPALRGSGYDTELDEHEPDRLVCSWEGTWEGENQLITLDIEVVDPADSPRLTRAELQEEGRQLIEDPRLDALGADAAGLVSQFSVGDSSVFLTVVIVTDDDFKTTVSMTEGGGGQDRPVGDAAIRTAELVSGTR